MSGLNYYTVGVAPGIRALKNAHAFITKAHKHVVSNNLDAETFLTASLHPDMKDFRFQIYTMTDVIKGLPPRLNPSIQPMTITDDQKTFEELLARIEKTISYLEGLKESDLEQDKVQEEVVFKFPGRQIKLSPLDFVSTWAHPNMWFHVVTAYDILRMKGVDLGKFDFLNGAGLVTIEEVA